MQISERLKIDIEKYECERSRFNDSFSLCGDSGRPFMFEGSSNVAIIFVHGYLASPGEMKSLAEDAMQAGYFFYVPRLLGHGTNPRNILFSDWKSWVGEIRGIIDAYSENGKKVVLAGFSNGALLSLYLNDFPGVCGVVLINPPLYLKRKITVFLPFVDSLLSVFRNTNSYEKFWVINHVPENERTNYRKNPLHGVCEIVRLSRKVITKLKSMTCPLLVIEGTDDPVVRADSGRTVIRLSSSVSKKYISIETNRHVIVKNFHGEIFQYIRSFINELS